MNVLLLISGKDRPGMVASVTKEIYQAAGNLEDASMTILQGEFVMMLVVHFESQTTALKFHKNISTLQRKLDLQIVAHSIKHALQRGEKHKANTTPYTISVIGKDQAGILYHVTDILAKKNLNITDLSSKIIGTGTKAVYTIIVELDMPKSKLIEKQLAQALSQLQKKINVRIHLAPLESATL